MTLTFLERFRPRRETPLPPVIDGLAQVRAYWEGLRGDGTLPARAALDPRGLAGVLDRVFLAERIGRGLAQVRIAGSGLADFAGLDLRGLPLSCLFAPESRPVLAQTMEPVFQDPAVAELDLGSDRGAVGALVARMLLLPLADEGGGRMILGMIGFRPGAAGRCKFQVLSRRENPLTLAHPEPVGPDPAPLRRVGHLALVHSAS